MTSNLRTTSIALAAAALAAVIGTASAYESLEALNQDFATRKTEAIAAYIDANPEAADAVEAEDMLIYNLIEAEQYEPALARFQTRYDALTDLDAMSADELMSEYIAPMFYLTHMLGRKDDAQALITSLRERLADHESIDMLESAFAEMASILEQPGVGDRIDIAFESLDGKAIDLADYRGQVVLVDFWATWCMPCIQAMPSLKAAYADFHERGFEIIGISLDTDEDRLRNYLTAENIQWPQQFDGLGWENAFVEQFGIQGIPATFLIDQSGEIVAVNPSESELKRRLAELLPLPETSDDA